MPKGARCNADRAGTGQIGGLEVLNANAIWVKVRVIEHAFVVNTGSYFELLSGGRWRSTIHRVCAKVRENVL
jgi:isopenicillin N synthase-like dioxygenase